MAPAGRARTNSVYLELGKKRVFASAADWPGWCRQGNGEQAAIEALAAARPRYAEVARAAAIPFAPTDVFDIVERLPGDATTDFGAPGAIAKSEWEKLSAKDLNQMCALLAGSWTLLDRVVAKAPPDLRKGPRGGGRDRDAMFDHVLDAEAAYAPKLGLKLKKPEWADRAAVREFRDAILAQIRGVADGSVVVEAKWPPRYVARRIGWHATDHAWEIEDRSER
jgi:hypothetical protein